MLVKYTDFNNAGALIESDFAQDWAEIERVLRGMSLFLKGSLQAGIEGRPIFDPVGANLYIKDELDFLKWKTQVPIPEEFRFLGTDVDLAKQGAIGEVQFSTYPYLLNNLVRSELFFKSKTVFDERSTQILFYITKARMFPASNGTLYFEQSERQLASLATNHVFDIPIRLVGLFEPYDTRVPVHFVNYVGRTSRTVVETKTASCIITTGTRTTSRDLLTLYEGETVLAEAEATESETT